MEEQELYTKAVDAAPAVFEWFSGYATWDTALQLSFLIISFIIARFVSRYVRDTLKKDVSPDARKRNR